METNVRWKNHVGFLQKQQQIRLTALNPG